MPRPASSDTFQLVPASDFTANTSSTTTTTRGQYISIAEESESSPEAFSAEYRGFSPTSPGFKGVWDKIKDVFGFRNRRGERECGRRDKRLWIVIAIVFFLGVLILSSSGKKGMRPKFYKRR